jgi:hypothetical protein
MASLVQRTRKLTLAWFSSSSSNNTNQRQQQQEQEETTDRRDEAQVTTVDASAGEEEPKVEEDTQHNSLLEGEEAAGSAPGSPADYTSTSTTTAERGNTSPVSDRSGQEDVALLGNKQTEEGKLGAGGAQGPSTKQATVSGAKKVRSETQQRTKKAKKNESDEKESGDNAQRERRPTLFRLRTQSLANIFQRSSSLDSSTTGEDGAVLDPAQADGPNEKAGLMYKEGLGRLSLATQRTSHLPLHSCARLAKQEESGRRGKSGGSSSRTPSCTTALPTRYAQRPRLLADQNSAHECVLRLSRTEQAAGQDRSVDRQALPRGTLYQRRV